MSRTILGSLAIGMTLTAGLASAGTHSGAIGTLASLAVSGQANEAADARQQVIDLLGRARQAMDEGNLETAESLVSRAESIDVGFGLFHLGDTPKKARRDLDRMRETAGAQPQPNVQDPFASRTAPAETAGVPMSDPLDAQNPSAATLGQPMPAMAAAPGNRAQCDQLLMAARQALAAGQTSQARQMLADAGAMQVTYDFHEDSPAKVEALLDRLLEFNQRGDRGSPAYQRQWAELQMEQAQGLMQWQRFDAAERLLVEVQQANISFGPFETTPDSMLARIAEARGAAPRSAAPQQVDAANQVAIRRLPTPESTNETTPAAMQATMPMPPQQPQSAAAGDPKQQVLDLVSKARMALAAGDMDQAESLALDAQAFGIPDSQFGPQDDRPWLVLLEVNKARRRSGGDVMPAAAVAGNSPNEQNMYPGAQAFYDPQNDPTRNIPAAAQSDTVPPAAQAMQAGGPQVSEAMRLLLMGEQALRQRDLDAAQNLFQQAQARQNELDPQTRQRLQDRLMLVAQSGVVQAAARGESLIDEEAQVQQLLARQISAEVSRHEAQARQLQDTDPQQSRDLLLQARAMVEKSGLEPESRAILLRRVDRNLGELDEYVEHNQPKIDLARRNREVEAQIEHEQQMTVEVQEKLALMVDEFNTLMDEQRFAEAEVVAKRAAELAPNERVVSQLTRQANLMRRLANNGQLADDKANGFVSAMESVEQSSIPTDDRIPMIFPDLKTWQRLTEVRGSMQANLRARRSEKELEIEQRLKTPVSLKFRDAPLAQVLDQLGKLAQINVYIDPRGLADEAVSTDTPVTIDLSQEISVKSALNLILEPLHLSFVIKDEVLKITSEDLVHGEVYPVTYYVSDLIMPIPNFVPNSKMGMAGALSDALGNVGVKQASHTPGNVPQAVMASADGSTNSAVLDPRILGQFNFPMGAGSGGPPSTGQPQNFGFASPAMGGGVEPDFESLIDLITNTIEPTTWADVGGAGAIERFETNLSLVISQTQEVHEKIADLLEQLRRLQDLQVTIEVRFINLADTFFEQIGIDFDFDIDDDIDNPFQVFGRPNDQAATQINRANFTAATAQALANQDGLQVGTLQRGSGDPPRDVQDRDHISTTVGMIAPGLFSADLDIPFHQGSFFQTGSALALTSVTPAAIPNAVNGVVPGGASLGFAILSDLEAYFFINAVQGDVRSNVLQAPKVTLFNGQQAFVSDTVQVPFVISVIPVVGDFAAAQQPVIVVLSEGTFLSVQAVVSSDRRFIRLTVVPFFSTIGDVNTFTFTGETTTTARSQSDGPEDNTTSRDDEVTQTTVGTTVQLPSFQFTTVTTTVSVPDGGTVLLGGIKRMEERRTESGVPLLNKLPYLNRLFSNVTTGKGTNSLMMMVTPRIIIQEEEEALLGTVPSY